MVRYADPDFQELIKNVVRFFSRNWFDAYESGRENVPAEGPVIYSFNHVYLWDPFLIGRDLEKIHALSKKEPFNIFLRTFQRKMGSIPVHSHKDNLRYIELTKNLLLLFPKELRDLFRQEVNQYLLPDERLDKDDPLPPNLFVEYVFNTGGGMLMHIPGGRYPSYDPIPQDKLKPGAAVYALRMLDKYGNSVPIVPGAIVYGRDGEPYIPPDITLPNLKFWRRDNKPHTTQPLIPKRKTEVYVRFGEPITVEDYLDAYRADIRDKKPDTVNELTDVIANEIESEKNLIIANL